MDDLSDGQFSFTEIYAYLPCGRYPSGYSKREKPVLRRFPIFTIIMKTPGCHDYGKYSDSLMNLGIPLQMVI